MLHCCCVTRNCHKEHPQQRKLLYRSGLPWSHSATSGILSAEGVKRNSQCYSAQAVSSRPLWGKKHSADIRGQTAVKTFDKIIYTTEERKDQRPQQGVFYKTKELTHLFLAFTFFILISGQNRLFDYASNISIHSVLKKCFLVVGLAKREWNKARTFKGHMSKVIIVL